MNFDHPLYDEDPENDDEEGETTRIFRGDHTEPYEKAYDPISLSDSDFRYRRDMRDAGRGHLLK